MQKAAMVLLVLGMAAFFVACAAKGKYHDAQLPDPKGYNAHFGNMDSGGDGTVSWKEFKAYFPKTEPKVFSAIDLNKDGFIDHDEWHKFKEAHGLKHEE